MHEGFDDNAWPMLRTLRCWTQAVDMLIYKGREELEVRSYVLNTVRMRSCLSRLLQGFEV